MHVFFFDRKEYNKNNNKELMIIISIGGLHFYSPFPDHIDRRKT